MVPKVGDRKVLMECLGPCRKAAQDAKVASQLAEQKKVIMKFKEMPVRSRTGCVLAVLSHGVPGLDLTV